MGSGSGSFMPGFVLLSVGAAIFLVTAEPSELSAAIGAAVRSIWKLLLYRSILVDMGDGALEELYSFSIYSMLFYIILVFTFSSSLFLAIFTRGIGVLICEVCILL